MAMILLPTKAPLSPTRAKKNPLTRLKIRVSEILLTLLNPSILLRNMMLIPSEHGSTKPINPKINGMSIES
jgi:arginine exporter protein ArgO